MNSSSNPSGRTVIGDELDVVEVDAERERFQARFDRTELSASLAIVEMIASIGDTSPLEITPISTTIDTVVLDTLLSTSPTGDQGCNCITVHYEGFEATVHSDGRLEADPLEQT